MEWGEKQVSTYPLRFKSIKRSGSDTYEVYAETMKSCQYHVIEVKAIDCDGSSCTFEVVRNEVVNHV